MKKILLITKFFPPEHGGIQSYLYNLILGLEKEKIVVMTHWSDEMNEVNFVRSDEMSPNKIGTNFVRNDEMSPPKADEFRYNNKFCPDKIGPQFVTPKIYHANFESPWRFLHLTTFDLFFKARRIIKAQKIEKILCGHLPIVGPLAFLIKKFYGLPYIVFSYGMEIFAIQKQSVAKQKMFKKILVEAEKIIVIADFMTGYLKKEFGIDAEKIVKIPPGVDSEVFRPIKRNDEMNEVNFVRSDEMSKGEFRYNNKFCPDKIGTQFVTPNRKILLTCGRLVARKNHISVIRTLPQIIKEIPDVLYIITGTGPEEKNLKNEVVKLRLENYVKFLGEIPEKDLPKIYNLANLFVMPAREIAETGDIEGFGVVFLEAAACGLPCIGGNTGGQAEAIENDKTGFLVNPNSLDEIANAILKIIKNTQLSQQMGQAGRDRAVREFNWKTQAEKLKKVL